MAEPYGQASTPVCALAHPEHAVFASAQTASCSITTLPDGETCKHASPRLKPAPLERTQFGERFRASFIDPAVRAEAHAIARLEEIAWATYSERR